MRADETRAAADASAVAVTLYYHPLASFCHKVLMALYENGTPFAGEIVNLMDKDSSARLRALWPLGKFPVLRDEGRDRTLPETTMRSAALASATPRGSCSSAGLSRSATIFCMGSWT